MVVAERLVTTRGLAKQTSIDCFEMNIAFSKRPWKNKRENCWSHSQTKCSLRGSTRLVPSLASERRRTSALPVMQAKRLIELHETFERSSPLFVPFSNTRLDASWCSAHQAPLDETANHASVDKTQHADFHLVLSKFLKLTWKQLDWVD